MSEMESLLEKVVESYHWEHVPAAEVEDNRGSKGCLRCEVLLALLRCRLLLLLEAGADMRYQEWPATMTHGPAKDWDDALAATRRGGPDV